MNEPEIDYNEIVLEQGKSLSRQQMELSIAKAVCAELAKHYPHVNWACAIDLDQGVIGVMCPEVSNTAAHVIHLSRTMTEIRGMLPKVGGEILERGGIPRERGTSLELIESLPRNVRGNIDNSDVVAPEEERAKRSTD